MTSILLTNDDGYRSKGINALFAELKKIGQVTMVAPDRDNSAVSHSLTMNRPLRVVEIAQNVLTVDGTPADCVALAINKILPKKPDLLVSGINSGPNLGDDISYSGTVSAAIEGTMCAIPSLAFSLAERDGDYDKAAEFATRIASITLEMGLPENTLLNINLPAKDFSKGVRITRQGRRTWKDGIQETSDPWGRKIYWIGGGVPSVDAAKDTDVHGAALGYTTITPIHLDKTNHEGVFHLQEDWPLEEIFKVTS